MSLTKVIVREAGNTSREEHSWIGIDIKFDLYQFCSSCVLGIHFLIVFFFILFFFRFMLDLGRCFFCPLQINTPIIVAIKELDFLLHCYTFAYTACYTAYALN